MQLATFLAILLRHKLQAKLQEALHKVESGSTIRNECRNVAMLFQAIAQCNIPLTTCLAIFLLSS